MARWTWMVGTIALLVAGLQGRAWADKVTLVSGDVLHGEVLEETGGRVRLQHAVLGEVELSPMRLELTYAHPIRKHLDVTAAFIANYVPEPPDGIDPLDTKVVLGIRYRK